MHNNENNVNDLIHQQNALIARLLGIYFYYSPKDPIFKQCQATLLSIDSLFIQSQQTKAEQDQLLSTLQPLVKTLGEQINHPELAYQFSVLFEGQGKMIAPPWGSVYQDHEQVLFGESTFNYQNFLQQNEIQLNSSLNEPVDQIGLMLIALSFLLEKNNLNAVKQLLTQYLLPWSDRYIQLVQSCQISAFYADLAAILELYLNKLQIELGVTSVIKPTLF